MPTTKSHLTDLDYDLAQLGDPLTADALDMLSTVLTARDALNDLLGYMTRVQNRLEAGATPDEIRETFGPDLDDLTDTITAAIVWVNN